MPRHLGQFGIPRDASRGCWGRGDSRLPGSQPPPPALTPSPRPKHRVSNSLGSRLLLTVGVGVLAATGSSADPAHPLFSQVTANPPIGVAIPKDPYAKATWYGRRQTYPEPEGLKDLDSLTLNLAPRVQLLAHQERATEPNPGHEFWVGSIDGDPGSRVEIVRVGGSIAGSIPRRFVHAILHSSPSHNT